jgi:class 3 adenylate cyclase
MVGLPSATVTFLFTDLEGSTRLWEEHPEAMKGAMACHAVVRRNAVELHNGEVGLAETLNPLISQTWQ